MAAQNRRTLEVQVADPKSCNKCRAVKPLDEFHRHKERKGGRSGQCKECAKESGKQHYQKNCQRLLEVREVYRQENLETIREKDRRYYQKNISNARLYYQENRGTILDKKRRYRKTDPGRAASLKSTLKRRALQKGATYENFSVKEVFVRDRYICQACGIKTRPDYKNSNHPKYPNLDHIIPISMGGEHSKRNTQCLCRKCNLQKGNRHANDQMLLVG